MSPSVFRFAPSPNGYLHLGHAYSALLNAQLARAAGGRLLLRIEDIDASRCRPEYETAIYQDLAWLGIAWDIPVRRQSEHFAAYAEALARLRALGLVYESFATRGEIARRVAVLEAQQGPFPRDPDGAPLYPGGRAEMADAERARRMAAEEPYAIRLDVTEAVRRVGALSWQEEGEEPPCLVTADPAAWGDVVLARKDVPTSYHLAVVVDDALQGVTDVVRGRDLYWATSLHRLLQALLGLPAPRYRHHRLVLDADGRKLSKSTQATGLRELRAAGVEARAVRARLGFD
ncbi:MAG: tRNA glutamyl-Q(34) synthetase GluQRS [Variibacter sp.]|nr:tRNA glutamyl-Q(34) synthetase GluQRS [Variibacter sp.]